MKETFAKALQYIGDLFGGWWEKDFSRGVVCGLAVYFLVVWLVRLGLFLYRRERCNELVIAGENGKISVSLRAVTSAVRAGLRMFDRLEITGIVIRRRGHSYAFVVNGRLELGNTGAPELRIAVADKIRADMKNSFGVDDIQDIDLRIEDCGGEPPEGNSGTRGETCD